MSENFTNRLIHERGNALAEEVFQNQFIQNVKKGVIEPQYLIEYVNQDTKYLDLFMKIHRKLLNEITDQTLSDLFQEVVSNTERTQHERLCELANVNLAKIINDGMLDGTKNYMNNMRQALQTDNQLMILSAILPCHWIYNQFANELLNQGLDQQNPFYDWVKVYADSGDSIQLIFNYINQIATKYSKEDQVKTQTYFNENCAYENQFFQQVIDKQGANL